MTDRKVLDFSTYKECQTNRTCRALSASVHGLVLAVQDLIQELVVRTVDGRVLSSLPLRTRILLALARVATRLGLRLLNSAIALLSDARNVSGR